MKNNIILPLTDWAHYEKIIKTIGEKQLYLELSEDQKEFLSCLGFISDKELSEDGYKYFEFKFIKADNDSARKILFSKILLYPPAQLICLLLWGVKNATRDNALAILRNREYWHYTNEKPLTNLLVLMNEVGIIRYSKKFRTIQVVYNLNEIDQEVPSNIFIEPNKHYSNRVWLKRILSNCGSYIYWMDKHFQKQALEIIWEVADGNKISEIKILSLNLGVGHISKKVVEDYFKLKDELLKTRNIKLTWQEIDSKLVRDTHDRWVMCEKNAWNIPNVNAIFSGQRSEINKSASRVEILKVFNDYFKMGKEISVKI